MQSDEEFERNLASLQPGDISVARDVHDACVTRLECVDALGLHWSQRGWFLSAEELERLIARCDPLFTIGETREYYRLRSAGFYQIKEEPEKESQG